jgi:hypothetical protein
VRERERVGVQREEGCCSFFKQAFLDESLQTEQAPGRELDSENAQIHGF